MRVLFRPERRCNQRLLITAEALQRQEMVQVRDGPIGRAPSRRAKVRFRAGTSCPMLWRFSDAGPDTMIVTRLRAGVRKPPGEETAGATTRLEIAPVYGDLARRSRDRRSPVRRLEGAQGALTGLGVELRRGDDDRGLCRIGSNMPERAPWREPIRGGWVSPRGVGR